MAKLYPIVHLKKYGFINQTGEIVVPPIYDHVGEFSEGRAWVRNETKRGFIDTKGREVVPLEFDEVRDFSEGLAAVRRGKESGFIDKSGDWVFHANVQFLIDTFSSNFREGVAKVLVKNRATYVDANGETKITLSGKKAGCFSEGLAPAMKSKWGYVNHQGEFAIPPAFTYARPFSQGLAAVASTKKCKHDRSYNQTGYINTAGDFVIEPQFQIALDFSQGLALVYTDTEACLRGFIDRKGRWKIEPIYESAGSFSEGLAEVKLPQNDKWAFINKKGEEVIPAKWDQTRAFRNGLALVFRGDSQAYINKDGAVIWEQSKRKAAKRKAESKRTKKNATKTKQASARQLKEELLRSQLSSLAECGIQLNIALDFAEIIRTLPKDYLETESFEPLLAYAAAPAWWEAEAHCDVLEELWTLDSYYGPQTHVDLLKRACQMTGGALTIAGAKTSAAFDDELEMDQIRVSCKINGKAKKFTYLDDFTDEAVFDDIASLLKRTKSTKVFFRFEVDTQIWIYGCLPKQMYNALCKQTGMSFELL